MHSVNKNDYHVILYHTVQCIKITQEGQPGEIKKILLKKDHMIVVDLDEIFIL